jgi:cation diffusion facilitator family transporter
MSMPNKQRFIFATLLLEVGFLGPDIVVAMLAGSLTVWADLWRCAIETLAVFFAWLTIRKVDRASSQPEKYGYGLGKLESMSTVLIAAIFVMAAALIAVDARAAFGAPALLRWANIAPAFVVNLIGVVIDGGLWWKHRALAAREYSPVIEAEKRLYAIKTLADVLVGVALALGASLRHAWVGYVDPVSSLVIAVVMLYSAYGILSESVRDLLDVALDEGLQLQVLRCLALHFEDYRDFHGVRSRRGGSKTFVEVFLEFDPERRMGAVQAVIDLMRAEMMRAIPGSFVSIVPVTEGITARPALARVAERA